ncbi:unnamed protein product [Agarophyton chilense]
MLLPSWMKKYSYQLEMCGIQKMLFALEDEKLSATFVSRSGGTKAKVTLNYEYEEMDVIGANIPRGKREFLAYDIAPYISMMEMFLPSERSTDFSFQCLSSDPDTCTGYRHHYIENTSLNPLLLIDARIANSKEYQWPKSLLRLIRNSVMGKLKIVDMKELYGWKVRSTASCFGSVLSTNVRTSDMSRNLFPGTHRFFSLNGLSRNITGRVRNSIMPCICKVLVLNRFGKRFMIGGDILTRAIESFGKKVSDIDPTVRIEAEEVFFDNSSFHEQVSVVQQSSIVVASHGDANSNFMFLKPESYVFEIMPYGFKSDIFRNLSVAYGAQYELIRSQADNEVFKACVEHYNSNGGPSLTQYLISWERGAQMFWNETIQRRENVGSNFEIPEDEDQESSASLKNLRECASYQRLSVDLKDLARRVVQVAVRQCRVEGDLGFLHH